MTIDLQKLQHLIDAASGDDQARLVKLRKLYLAKRIAFQEKSTKPRTKAFKKAQADLAAAIDKLLPKYLPHEVDIPESFPTQAKALDHLRSKGYTISAGKISGDIKAGLLTQQQDRSIRRHDLESYATNHIQSGARAFGDELLNNRKLEQEVELNDIRIGKEKQALRTEDDKWMLTEDHDVAMAALINVVRDALKHQIYIDHLAMVQVVEGNSARSAEMMDKLNDLINAAFNNVAKMGEVDVHFEEDEELTG